MLECMIEKGHILSMHVPVELPKICLLVVLSRFQHFITAYQSFWSIYPDKQCLSTNALLYSFVR